MEIVWLYLLYRSYSWGRKIRDFLQYWKHTLTTVKIRQEDWKLETEYGDWTENLSTGWALNTSRLLWNTYAICVSKSLVTFRIQIMNPGFYVNFSHTVLLIYPAWSSVANLWEWSDLFCRNRGQPQILTYWIKFWLGMYYLHRPGICCNHSIYQKLWKNINYNLWLMN